MEDERLPYDYEEFSTLLREATQSVEQELNIEDQGWSRLGGSSVEVIPAQQRVANVRASRQYHARDPLAKQAVRLWTDYTFGSGMTFTVPDDAEATLKALKVYWDSPQNRPVLSARGQRKTCDKLMVDGEVFLVVFEGMSSEVPVVRWIDPLEIVEIVTDPDDIETPLFYKRQWADRQGSSHTAFYRSEMNRTNISTIDATRRGVSATDDGIVFHLAYNTTTQRGNPLLLPALDWIKQYRRFLASRVAIMLALSRFAWRSKVKGGATQVDAQKAKVTVDDDPPQAASWIFENEGVDTTPIKTETGAKNASVDGNMLKLQVSAATGIPLQYFGDVSIGNFATSKTVELPMMKMFQSLQQVFKDFYQGPDELVLEHASVPPEKWYVDRDFPRIAPTDMEMASKAVKDIVEAFPSFKQAREVQQTALMAIGIDDTGEVLDNLEDTLSDQEEPNEEGNKTAVLTRAIRALTREWKEGVKNATQEGDTTDQEDSAQGQSVPGADSEGTGV